MNFLRRTYDGADKKVLQKAIRVAVLCAFIGITTVIICTKYINETKLVAASYRPYDKWEYFVHEQTVSTDYEIETKEKEDIEFCDSDIDLMARVVMSEASILSIDAKEAVAQTIINRVHSDKFPNTVNEVVYQKNQYSTLDNGRPDVDCYEAVKAAIKYEPFPHDMYYFRTDYYHDFGSPYMVIENTYFSTESENGE